MLNLNSSTVVNDKKVRLAKGTCKTYNICYLAVCDICNKPYTGRTVDPMHNRSSCHHHKLVEISGTCGKYEEDTLQTLDTNNDLYTLGLHLHLEHG